MKRLASALLPLTLVVGLLSLPASAQIRAGLINLATQVTGDLPFANLTQGSALSVLGVTGNATADVASIAAGSDHQVLRRSGTSLAFGALNLAQSAAVTGALPGANGGTGYTSVKAAGICYNMLNGYVDGTGTAGVDNTAQTVKTIVVPANTLTQVGDWLELRVTWRPDTGTALTFTGTLNGVTLATGTSATGAVILTSSITLYYVDSTHANVVPGANNGTANLAGLDWTAAQDFDWDQNLIANNHIVVYSIVSTVCPKGVAAG